MELAFLAWAMDFIPGLSLFFVFVPLLVGLVMVMVVIIRHEDSDQPAHEVNKQASNSLKKIVLGVALCWFIATIVPSDKGMKWIVGAYLAQTTYEQVVEIDGVKELPEKAVAYMTDFFETVDKDDEEKEPTND